MTDSTTPEQVEAQEEAINPTGTATWEAIGAAILTIVFMHFFSDQSNIVVMLAGGCVGASMWVLLDAIYNSDAGRIELENRKIVENNKKLKREKIVREYEENKKRTRLDLQELNPALAQCSFQLISGDYGNGIRNTDANTGYVMNHGIMFPMDKDGFFTILGKRYSFSDIVSFNIISESNRRGMVNLTGWSAVGAVVAGPIGAVGMGALANSKEDWIQFSLTFSDEKRVLGEIKQKYFPQFRFALGPALDTASLNQDAHNALDLSVKSERKPFGR